MTSRTLFREAVLEVAFFLEGHARDLGLLAGRLRRALAALLLGQEAYPKCSTKSMFFWIPLPWQPAFPFETLSVPSSMST